MYARIIQRPKQRKAQLKKFSAPVAGWIANRALSDPASIEGQGAAVLDNFIPRQTSVVLRRGKQLYATLADGLPCTSLFAYVNGNNQHMFAASSGTIYDITSVPFPDAEVLSTEDGDELSPGTGNVFGWSSTGGLDVMTGFAGGDWSTVQFETDGGVYLVGVNGVDTGFIFDGTNFYPNVAGGVYGLDYVNETVSFTEGAVLTGGTSGATATIYRIMDHGGGTGTFLLTNVSGGPFQNGEALTDIDGGAADADGIEALVCPGMDFSALGMNSADMSYVWTYKERLWFIQKNSMNAWYMPVAAIGGTADYFPLGGVFSRGGSLLFGSGWSLDQSGLSGLTEQVIFVSTEGEVAVYQGSAPGEASTFNKAGLYRIGSPLGKHAHFRGGGDIAIATSVGLVPLSKAISLDITSLGVATVSYRIADAWSDAVSARGMTDWHCVLWPEQKIAIVSPPDVTGASEPVLFVSNSESGAWCRFTGWHALCLLTFRGELYFGSPDGRIFKANSGGYDYGQSYTGSVLPLFDDLGSPASLKTGKVARAVFRANAAIDAVVEMQADFDAILPPAPNASPVNNSNLWGTAVWNGAVWGGRSAVVISDEWHSAGNAGYTCSLSAQITSGSIGPLDGELIRMELLYDVAEMVT